MGRLLLAVYILLATHAVSALLGREHFTRKVTSTLNPDCPETICGHPDDDQPAIVTVIHVRAAGTADVIHHVWDFTGKPTVLVARTSPNATLSIDWFHFWYDVPGSVSFDEKPMYTSTLTVARLLQYNDAGHEFRAGRLQNETNQQPIIAYDTQNLTWTRTSFDQSDYHAGVEVDGTNADWLGPKGAVRLRFNAFGRRQYDLLSPHMLHSENGTQVEVVLDHLRVVPPAATDDDGPFGGRFALEMVHVASEPPRAGSFALQRRRGLDDEHTPGVFELIDVVSPAVLAHANGSYIHFRPVSYTSADRDMATSVDVHVEQPQNVSDAVVRLNGSLAWSYYGYQVDFNLAQAYNVSFGRKGDGFYAKSGYNTWTFMMGVGVPPEEQMSMFVVIVASVGLVLPVVLLLSGGLYICARRMRSRRHTENFY